MSGHWNYTTHFLSIYLAWNTFSLLYIWSDSIASHFKDVSCTYIRSTAGARTPAWLWDYIAFTVLVKVGKTQFLSSCCNGWGQDLPRDNCQLWCWNILLIGGLDFISQLFHILSKKDLNHCFFLDILLPGEGLNRDQTRWNLYLMDRQINRY